MGRFILGIFFSLSSFADFTTPDGKFTVFTQENDAGYIYAWLTDNRTHNSTNLLECEENFYATVDPTGDYLIVAGLDEAVQYDMRYKRISKFYAIKNMSKANFFAKGKFFVAYSKSDKRIRVFNTSYGDKLVDIYIENRTPIKVFVDFTINKMIIAYKESLEFWDVKLQKQIGLTAHHHLITHMQQDHNGKELALATVNGDVFAYSLDDFEQRYVGNFTTLKALTFDNTIDTKTREMTNYLLVTTDEGIFTYNIDAHIRVELVDMCHFGLMSSKALENQVKIKKNRNNIKYPAIINSNKKSFNLHMNNAQKVNYSNVINKRKPYNKAQKINLAFPKEPVKTFKKLFK